MQYLRYALMDFDFIASASSDKGQKVKGEGPSMTKDPAGGGTQLDTQGLIYEWMNCGIHSLADCSKQLLK